MDVFDITDPGGIDWHDVVDKIGSFRSAYFRWRQSEATVGRKTARHDYPLKDTAYVEDMGGKPREFTLECFVIGKHYTVQRDALIAALEQEGSGILNHPTMGYMLVSLNGEVRLTETTSEGGMCRFSIPFVLAEEKKPYPSAAVDTAAAVDEQADAVIEAAQNDFEDKFSILDVPKFVADDAKSITETICSGIDGLSAKFPVSIETPAFVKALTKIQSSITTLLGKPLSLAQAISKQINKLRDLALAPLNLLNYGKLQVTGILNLSKSVLNLPMTLFKSYTELFNYGKTTSSVSATSSESISQTTPSRIQQAQNRDAMNALVRRTAIAEAARTSSTVEYDSYNDAVRVQEAIVDAIDTETLEASDDVYNALVDLRAAVVKDISTRSADLAHIVQYTPLRTEPALVIAHRLYGDASRAEEIIARNKIKHPLFVPGGIPLEVFSD